MEAPDPVPGRQAMQAAISRTKRGAQKRGLTLMGQPSLKECSGGVLLSHEASLAVPSALKSLTSGFGMGPGVSPSLWPPGTLLSYVGQEGSRPQLGNRTVNAMQIYKCKCVVKPSAC